MALHQRLGHTQLVDPVTHGRQVLLDRVFANFLQLGRGHFQTQHLQAVALAGGQGKVGKTLLHQGTSLLQRRLIGEAELNSYFLLRQAAIAHTLFAQQALDVAFVDFQARIDGFIHVHFQQEVHTTGQVQAQFHRASAQVAQPLRRGRCQVQRHHIIIAQGFTHHVFGGQLVGLVLQTQQASLPLFTQARRLDADTSVRQGLANSIKVGLIDLQRRAGTADLNGRIVRIEIRCGIDKADRQHCEDQQVFPQRVFIQHDAARL